MSEQIPTIAEAARLIAKKELSPVELTRACLDRIRCQRMHQHVEPGAVQHQIRDDMLELVRLEYDERVADRVRSARHVAELFDLDWELLAEGGAHLLGDGARFGHIVIDMSVIAQIGDGLRGLLGHRAHSLQVFHDIVAFSHGDACESMSPANTLSNKVRRSAPAPAVRSVVEGVENSASEIRRQ